MQSNYKKLIILLSGFFSFAKSSNFKHFWKYLFKNIFIVIKILLSENKPSNFKNRRFLHNKTLKSFWSPCSISPCCWWYITLFWHEFTSPNNLGIKKYFESCSWAWHLHCDYSSLVSPWNVWSMWRFLFYLFLEHGLSEVFSASYLIRKNIHFEYKNIFKNFNIYTD